MKCQLIQMAKAHWAALKARREWRRAEKKRREEEARKRVADFNPWGGEK